MRFKWIGPYWGGLGVAVSMLVLTLWLAAEGKLALYIHPRYIWFTIILCSLALLCLIADAASRKIAPKLITPLHIDSIAAGIISIAFCLGFAILQPAGLTSSTASQRGINTAALTVNTDMGLQDLSTAHVDYTQFTIKEWASLLAQTNNSALFAGKPAVIQGFVHPAPDNNPNVFYVSRFVMTCCAVDARPIGVPVYHPGWKDDFKIDQWLDVQGSFRQNPESSVNAIVVSPERITPISEPDEPYVY